MIWEVIAAKSVEHILKKPLENIYESSKSSIGKLWEEWNSPENITVAEKNINTARQVRTIACRSLFDLNDIYYPAKLSIKGKPVSVNNISEIQQYCGSDKIIITGIAGQGKSIFAKYLWITEIQRADGISILANLRDTNHYTLEEALNIGLMQLGINTKSNDEILNAILSNKNTSIILDGLDEVNRENLIALKSKIQKLTINHPRLKIIITSRPGSILDHIYEIPGFTFFELAKLTENDFKPFLIKVGTPEDVAENLNITLQKSENQNVKKIIDTPLMLTLLKIVYGHKTTIPENLPDLYTEMFNILAQTHDETKLGYVRQWATKLTVPDIRKLFEAFCYASFENASNSMPTDEFNESFETARDISDIKCTAAGFKTDMIESICLMAKDGLNTAFTHKSIQEFFCASFIANSKNDEFVEGFYKSMTGFGRHWKFSSVINFLSQMDRKRYVDYLIAPEWDDVCQTYGITKNKALTDQIINKILTSFKPKGEARTVDTVNTATKMSIFSMIIQTSLPHMDKKPGVAATPDDHIKTIRTNKSIKAEFKKNVESFRKTREAIVDQCRKSESKKHQALIATLRNKIR